MTLSQQIPIVQFPSRVSGSIILTLTWETRNYCPFIGYKVFEVVFPGAIILAPKACGNLQTH